MVVAGDATHAAHPFMLLTIEAALTEMWRRLAVEAAHAPNPDDLVRLVAREAALRPVRMRHYADLVRLALA